MVAQMNITEKINMVHGWGTPYVGGVIANTRLGIPALNLNDGPQVCHLVLGVC
jgi:beta-glucosidase